MTKDKNPQNIKNFLTQDNLEMFIVVLIFTLLFAIQILAIFWQVEEKEKKKKAVSQRIEQIEQKLEEIISQQKKQEKEPKNEN